MNGGRKLAKIKCGDGRIERRNENARLYLWWWAPIWPEMKSKYTFTFINMAFIFRGFKLCNSFVSCSNILSNAFTSPHSLSLSYSIPSYSQWCVFPFANIIMAGVFVHILAANITNSLQRFALTIPDSSSAHARMKCTLTIVNENGCANALLCALYSNHSQCAIQFIRPKTSSE